MQSLFNTSVIDKEEARTLSPQILAFVGDAVHSLFVRQAVVLSKKHKIKDLHSATVQHVKASGQSDAIKRLLTIFSEEEKDIYRRARNYKTTNISKNASVSEYRRATGFEAVLGYLYLSGQFERLQSILEKVQGENYEN